MMKPINQAQISFDSRSVNESFGRAAVAAFLTQLDPTVADLTDMKTLRGDAELLRQRAGDLHPRPGHQRDLDQIL